MTDTFLTGAALALSLYALVQTFRSRALVAQARAVLDELKAMRSNVTPRFEMTTKVPASREQVLSVLRKSRSEGLEITSVMIDGIPLSASEAAMLNQP